MIIVLLGNTVNSFGGNSIVTTHFAKTQYRFILLAVEFSWNSYTWHRIKKHKGGSPTAGEVYVGIPPGTNGGACNKIPGLDWTCGYGIWPSWPPATIPQRAVVTGSNSQKR